MTRQRLQKLIAAAGLCSRRKAEVWLQQGRVTVDQQQAGLGDQADPEHQLICVDGQPLPTRLQAGAVDQQTRRGDQQHPRSPGASHGSGPGAIRAAQGAASRWTPDADSRGALLLSDVGELTLRLTHPRYDHHKTYRVWVESQPSGSTLQRWRVGFPGWTHHPSGSGPHAACERQQTLLEVVLQEGRNRQIRRVADGLGHPVLDLQRTAIAHIQLGDLSEGAGVNFARENGGAC